MPLTATPSQPTARHSPCVGVCKLDDRSGLCLGCARNADEIARWSGMDEQERDAVWDLLPTRAADASFQVRLLPWIPTEIGSWVARSISERKGTWVTGTPGAVAEFPCTPARAVNVVADEASIVARADDAAFRLILHDKLRAFAFMDGGPIVLGWPKARAVPYASVSLTGLGADVGAIAEDQRDGTLYDLGVGRASSRFCIRTIDGGLLATLKPLIGQHWSKVMYDAGMQILKIGPHRVVETQLARIEVFAPIPMPGGKSPDGAHTHFLPEFLKTGDEIPPSLALPDYASPVAIFYPGGGLA